MTTTVIIKACCSSDKEVSVSINSENKEEMYALQDGESAEYTIYDDRTLCVSEVTQSTE